MQYIFVVENVYGLQIFRNLVICILKYFVYIENYCGKHIFYNILINNEVEQLNYVTLATLSREIAFIKSQN